MAQAFSIMHKGIPVTAVENGAEVQGWDDFHERFNDVKRSRIFISHDSFARLVAELGGLHV